MITKLWYWWQEMRSSFWFVPAVIVLGAMGLATGLIALKALSPSINDTTTAVTCLDCPTARIAAAAGRPDCRRRQAEHQGDGLDGINDIRLLVRIEQSLSEEERP